MNLTRNIVGEKPLPSFNKCFDSGIEIKFCALLGIYRPTNGLVHKEFALKTGFRIRIFFCGSGSGSGQKSSCGSGSGSWEYPGEGAGGKGKK